MIESHWWKKNAYGIIISYCHIIICMDIIPSWIYSLKIENAACIYLFVHVHGSKVVYNNSWTQPMSTKWKKMWLYGR